jgi:hypothetical protein
VKMRLEQCLKICSLKFILLGKGTTNKIHLVMLFHPDTASVPMLSMWGINANSILIRSFPLHPNDCIGI